MGRVVRIWRNRLPHWEVSGASYFVTIRCAGSLPKEILERLQSTERTLSAIRPNSDAFRNEQRKYFRILDRYLDCGTGFAPFVKPDSCLEALRLIREGAQTESWALGPAVVMPNHLHAIFRHREETSSCGLETFLKRLKGRTARGMNKYLGRLGKFWQREWFDRWIRSAEEFRRTVRYIENNPVTAGITESLPAYPGYYPGDDGESRFKG